MKRAFCGGTEDVSPVCAQPLLRRRAGQHSSVTLNGWPRWSSVSVLTWTPASTQPTGVTIGAGRMAPVEQRHLKVAWLWWCSLHFKVAILREPVLRMSGALMCSTVQTSLGGSDLDDVPTWFSNFSTLLFSDK